MLEAKAIRKHSAQHDLFHRLHSIAADEAFVRQVAEKWYETRFEVVANQRCGTWYCDPSTSSRTYAYFKSTDGHTNNWDFNLRRSNLPLASYAQSRGGLILVDSTRRGKRMPDALSKTVPIWCAVINLAIELRRKRKPVAEIDDGDWDAQLYLPPRIVSASEKAQIESLLPMWAAALEASALPLPPLSLPLRPFFIHPSTSVPPHIPGFPSYIPIICLSASRWVNEENGDEIPSFSKLRDGRTMGFEYVPGAGDDDELWGRGLSPAVFHANKVELLGVSREDLPGIVDELVRNTNTVKQLQGLQIAEPGFPPTDPFPGPSEPLAARRSHYTGVPTPGSRLALDIGTPVSAPPDPWSPDYPGTLSIYVASTEKHPKDPPFVFYAAGVILALPDPKNEPKRYSSALTAFVSIARHHLSNDPRNTVLLHPGRQRDVHTAIRNHRLVLDAHASPDGVIRNHSLDGVTHDPPDSLSPDELVIARKTILPLALLLLCALPEITSSESEVITKAVVADRFHGLIALWPDGNPSRAALKRVNEYLMSEGRG